MGDKFTVGKSNDDRSIVVKLPGDQVCVDLWDVSPRGASVAWEIAKLLDEVYATEPGGDPVSPFALSA